MVRIRGWGENGKTPRLAPKNQVSINTWNGEKGNRKTEACAPRIGGLEPAQKWKQGAVHDGNDDATTKTKGGERESFDQGQKTQDENGDQLEQKGL